MSDADRIQRWRQRMRDAGKEPISLWLSRDTKRRLEDLVAVWHCSPSDLVEQALAHFHPGTPSVPGIVADTEQLQAMLADAARALLPPLKREILQALQPAHASSPSVPVTDGNVTDTQRSEPHASPDPATVYAPEPEHNVVTEPAPTREGGRPRSVEGQQILALLAQHPEGDSVKGLAATLGLTENTVRLRVNALAKRGQVQMHGEGSTLRYVLAGDLGDV